NSPTWENVVQGQANVRDAVRREIALDTDEKSYRLNEEVATLLIRPRGWHLEERHFPVDGEPVSASLFDFGLVAFHNARALPDRVQVTMAVPFMHAYTELLVRTCHRRGAHAIGGMAAFIPSRKDPEVNRVALAKVREDKERESRAGFDGTWVAHPDLVPVATEIFDGVLGSRANQVERLREDVVPDEAA